MGELRRLRVVDESTGELLDQGVPVWVGAKIKSPYAGGWYMQSQEGAALIAKDKEMAGRPTRVLLYLASRLDFNNYIQVPNSEIAEDLDLDKANVSRALALLERKGVLLRGPKVGKSYGWRLNPNFGWKGKVKGMRDARREQLRVISGRGKA
jgi:DNA-binding transcriptional ArsR family regulator